MNYYKFIQKYYKLYNDEIHNREIENSIILTKDTELKKAVLLANSVLYYSLDWKQLTGRHQKPIDDNIIIPDIINDIVKISEDTNTHAINVTTFAYNNTIYNVGDYQINLELGKGIVHYAIHFDYIRSQKNQYKYFDINKKDVILKNTNLIKELQEIHDSIL